VKRVFLVYYSDVFRGSGYRAIVLVRAEDIYDALRRFAINVLNWEEDEEILQSEEKMRKFFFAGDNYTVVRDVSQLEDFDIIYDEYV